MIFRCINIRQVLWEGLKTAASGLDFQHLPRDLANVNAWKTMFDLYIVLPPERVTIKVAANICNEKIEGLDFFRFFSVLL